MPQVLSRAVERSRLHHPRVVVEVDDGLLPGDRRLHPAPFDGRGAVGAVAVVHPARHPVRVVSGIGLGRRRVDDVLAHYLRDGAHGAAEEVAEPGSGGHDDEVGGDRPAVQARPLRLVHGDPSPAQLPEVGIPIEQSNPEYAPGQVEVDIRYGPVLATADRVVAFRSFVKELAARHGFLATFMSKPFAAESGSGFHTHYSLWSEGANTFAGPDGHLSQIGLSYLAGMQERMAETALAAATTPNAYRRRRPYTFCPINNSWGHDNRTVGLRVIEGAPDAIRVEKRDGSAECNPYYLMACDLASGLDGIEQGLDPQHFTAGNGYEFPEAEPLPADLHTALRRARESDFLKRTLGEDRFEILAGQAERELAFMDEQVTEVEFDRYLRNF